MAGADLLRLSACEVVGLLRQGETTPLELLAALEERVEAVDGAVNALPTRCFDRARAAAEALLRRPVGERGALAGLPVPIKDLTDVEGVRTTYGTTVFAEHVPGRSDVLVQTLEAAGAVVYAKSNTPELGAGANTFNDVFGATRNPWNLSRSAAGSSGGAAAALATGTAWVAHGSDLGGSLRNPASFCGVVGLRPSPGRVARSPGFRIDDTLFVDGPMARSVEDAALLLDAMSGERREDPLSLPAPRRPWLEEARSGWRPRRVAWGGGLGITPVDPEVLDLCERAAVRFAEAGVEVEAAHPDLSGCHEAFRVLRARGFACAHARAARAPPRAAEAGGRLEHRGGSRADRRGRRASRVTALEAVSFQRTLAFFDDYDLLLSPATIVAPFPVEERYVASCAGQRFETYFEWLAIAYAISLVACPALSLPCGFTREGLPVGLQLVAPPRGEARLLAGACLLEEILGLETGVPIDPRPSGS